MDFILLVLWLVVHFPLFTLGTADYDGCLSFSCSNFLAQLLIIKNYHDDKPYCVLNETTKVGDTVTCPSRAIAKLVNGSYVFLSTPEKVKSPLFLEYGVKDELHGKFCSSRNEVCPTTPDYPETVNKKDYSLYILFVFILPFIIIAVVIRKFKNTPRTSNRMTENSTTGSESCVNDKLAMEMELIT